MDITELGWVLVCGIMGFFLLEKLSLWRHDHATTLGHTQDKPIVAMIVIGGSMHNFIDGVFWPPPF